MRHVAAKSLPPLLLAASLLAGCSSSQKLASGPAEPPVKVDGDPTEWAGDLQNVEKAGLSLGIRNDAERVYLCALSADPSVQAQILSQGLIFWFDKDGGRRRKFGIRYPDGGMPEIGGDRPRRSGEGRPGLEERRERMRLRLEEGKERVSFLSSKDGEGWTMLRDELRGIRVEAAFVAGRLVVELAVPFRTGEGKPFAIGTEAGRRIGIGLESPKADWEGIGENPGAIAAGPGGGPGGGMGGGMDGGMGGRGTGRVPARPEPIEAWLSVTLSPAP